MQKKNKIKSFLFTIIIGGFVGIFYLYISHFTAIKNSLNRYEGMWSITIFILFRISITIGMMIYAFWQWCKQKEMHFTDANFLFGLFFLGLVYGKLINLLYILTFYTAGESAILNLLKIRYILIVLTAAPLIFIGIDIVLSSINKNHKNLIDTHYRNKLNSIVIIVLSISESTIIILTPNSIILGLILISFHISSLIWISFTFYYSYGKKHSFQGRPLLISLAFFIDLILYIISIMTLPLRRQTIGYSAIFLIFAELFDLVIIIIIFIGYCYESN